jgi:hypothetical protein
MMRAPLLVLALLLGGTAFAPVRAQAPAAAPPSPVTELSPGVYQVGQARLEKATRTVTFPAAVNMDSGALEYLLVTREGPTHESLLVTGLAPQDLHVAMLLLGAKSTTPAKTAEAAPGQITGDYLKQAPALKGENISFTVSWSDPATGGEKTVPVEDWLLFGDTDKPPARGPWLYTGSAFGFNTGKFLAQEEGVHASLVTNPSALINNPRKGHDDDQVWSPNRQAVPKPETLVRITIQLLPKQ